MLIGVGSGSQHRDRDDARAEGPVPQPAWMTADRHRAVPWRPAASPHPVPKTLSADHPLPTLANASAQVNAATRRQPQVTNHEGRVRDVLACADQR